MCGWTCRLFRSKCADNSLWQHLLLCHRTLYSTSACCSATAPSAQPAPVATQYWTAVDSLYFCIVLVTTVGYGANLVPKTGWARTFTMYFTLTGLLVFGSITYALSRICSHVLHRFRLALTPHVVVVPSLPDKVAGLTGAATATPPSPLRHPSPSLVLFDKCASLFFAFFLFNYVCRTGRSPSIAAAQGSTPQMHPTPEKRADHSIAHPAF